MIRGGESLVWGEGGQGLPKHRGGLAWGVYSGNPPGMCPRSRKYQNFWRVTHPITTLKCHVVRRKQIKSIVLEHVKVPFPI